jgi:hypothetical protein
MLGMNLPKTAAALIFAAASFGLVAPSADAVVGSSAPVVTDSNIQLAYVKKKVVVKKKGYKKTTTVYSRNRHPYGNAYGFSVYRPYVASCRTVVKYVKYRNHKHSVRVVRRVC